ncbi:hypothetical protein OB920_19685 [Halobacteria archaeon HArc-gm2]|nr:hypothetical protein [Halobacteria archaeon HArc-gm2]
MSESNETRRGGWSVVDVPVTTSLHDVATAATGPVAAGNVGTVVARSADGAWNVLVENGPGASGETLYAVASTADGERIWFAGTNGALGAYEVGEGRRRDHSEPDGVTDSLSSLAVAGPRGSEKLLLADDNGAVYTAEATGTSFDWGREFRPAGDTALTDLAASPDGVGYAVDGEANVWQTTPDDGWEAIGVDAAENSLYAVVAGENRLLAGGGNGRVYLSSDGGGSWTPYSLGSFTVKTLDVAGGRALAAGSNGRLVTRGDDWETNDWDGSKTVNGVRLGDVDVAVCNDGVVLERSASSEGTQPASSGTTDEG